MEPGVYNFPKLYRGDTFNGLKFSISKNGKAEDLTDYVIRLQIVSGGSVFLELSNQDDSITVTNAKKGKFEINPFTVELPSGSYEYDIQFEFNDLTYTYLKGKISVSEDITK